MMLTMYRMIMFMPRMMLMMIMRRMMSVIGDAPHSEAAAVRMVMIMSMIMT